MPLKPLEEGDCCSSLAPKYGYLDYKGVYDAQTAAFKLRHPNPNQLTAGAQFTEPVPKEAPKARGTDTKHQFEVKKSKVSLRLRLRGWEGSPLVVKKVVLKPAGWFKDKTEYMTLPGGLLEQKDISLKWTEVCVTVELSPPPAFTHPAPAGPPPKAAGAMPYPPAVSAGQFIDTEDPRYLGTPATYISWDLKVGSLPTHKIRAGVEARLHNLAFPTELGLAQAVQAFQTWKNLTDKTANPVTGDWNDVAEDVRKVHDDA